MQQETIAERAAAIRLKTGDLSELSGLTPHTVGRTLNGRTQPLHKTFEALKAALEKEELRLRDYLLTLHPLKQKEGGEE